jgi:hypothetical protein
MPVGKHGAKIRRRWARKSRPTALLRMITVPGPTSVERSIRWPVVISVEDEHYTRRNSVNHRRNADESCHRGENGKGVRRDEPGREQAEATKEGNPTSSTRSPRVVAGRPLHGMRIASSALACPGKDESPGRRVPRLSQSHRFLQLPPNSDGGQLNNGVGQHSHCAGHELVEARWRAHGRFLRPFDHDHWRLVVAGIDQFDGDGLAVQGAAGQRRSLGHEGS